MVTRHRGRGLLLPWERRNEFLRGATARPHWAVLFALAVVVTSAYAVLRSASERHRRRETFAAIADCHRAMQAFRTEIGRCPRNAEELLDPPRGASRYLSELPRDGWGRDLRLRCAVDGDQPIDVVSAGQSGSFLVDDNLY